MFCPDINGSCNEECVCWDHLIKDCLRRLELKKRLDALTAEEKRKLTLIRKDGTTR